MATITTDTYLDGGVARTAGEAFAIGNGARFTIRTDSRIHANAPASSTGSLGSPTFTDIGGEFYIDSSSVREINYTGGTGNTPAIGTAITQGGVSGYYLGTWSAIGSAPVASGSALPASGIIKFREVTGGNFSAGALTGISATCSGPDKASWIEIAWDAYVNFVVGRVGKFTTRDGGNFYEIGQTNGSVGQTFTIPTTSSASTNNYCPGAWIETGVGTNEYEFWQGLSSAANGWVKTAIGFAEGYTDKRGKFLKTFGNGVLQIGESVTMSGTYATVAGQASAYAGIAISSSVTYIWVSDKITINTASTAHLFNVGQQVYLDFTSGSAVDGTYTITEVLDAYNFTVTSAGSGTGGNVTIRPGITITLASHGVGEEELVYCDFTSGTGVDGTYKVYAVTGTGTYNVEYPHSAALTSGNVTVNSRIQITATAHGMAVGNEVYCDFTSGGATNGKYIMRATAANTLDINYPFSAAITTSNVTLKWTLGHVPETGRKVRISNILWAECLSASRATNSIPNATIASRPEFTTTTAGAIDLEGLYVLSGRSIFAQPYSVRLRRCALSETLEISECATALDIDDIGIGMYSAQDVRAFLLTSNFAGGTINKVVAGRATSGATDHATDIVYCNGQTITNITTGIIAYGRSSGLAININTCQNITISNATVFNGNIPIVTSVNINLNDINYIDRIIGHTNAAIPYYAVTVGAGCDQVTLNGLITGYGELEDCHPYTGLVYTIGATNIKIRNVGSSSAYIKTGTWMPNSYGCGVAFVSGGNNNTVKLQKWFVGRLRTGLTTTINSDKNILVEQMLSENPWLHSAKAARTELIAWLNANIKGITTGNFITSAQTSVYGTHWIEQFQGNLYGGLILVMNEPTLETSAYWSNPSGVAKFNSAGGIEMRVIGAEAIWEMPYFSKGHTGFRNITPVMSGGTIGNYTITYQIDTGSGWNGSWLTLNGTNLSAETIGSTGFKLKIKIITSTTNSTAITFLRIETLTSKTAQEAIDYPLDTVPVKVTVLDADTKNPIQGARVYLNTVGSATQLFNLLTGVDGSVNTTTDEVGQNLSGRVRKSESGAYYKPGDIIGQITSLGFETTILLIPDS